MDTVACRDCGRRMSDREVANYKLMGGELQLGEENKEQEAICGGCIEERRSQDEFGPEDFMTEFCG